MSNFFDRAKRDMERNLLSMGKDKITEIKDNRSQQQAGTEILKHLGAAYYSERHGLGTPEATKKALEAVDKYISENGDAILHA
ncbi:hypothetical protein [Streptomyces sp. NPDC055085]